ncbi:MAG: hypothetical protein HY698_09480 [Deltaproteobacteria bacterium]|nr:hypothetical protein [Deltaproteobacteria bacterium]
MGKTHMGLTLSLACLACEKEPRPVEPDSGAPSFDAGALPTVECPLMAEATFVVRSFELLPPDEGLDQTGDGKPDNSLGFLHVAANQGWERDIRDGVAIYLWDLTSWTGTSDDDEIGLAFFHGVDADEPANALNNASGQGEFLIAREQLDVNCNPTTRFPEAEVKNGFLLARTPEFPSVYPDFGTVLLHRAHVIAAIKEDGSEIAGRMSAVWTACNLARIKFPGAADDDRSMLDFVVAFGVQPDIDMDSDGLETLVLGGSDGVRACLDGNGKPMDGRSCSCDPRVQDGYSLTFHASLVRARIIGFTQKDEQD